MAGAVPGNADATTSGSPAEVATLSSPQLAAYRQDVPLVAGASGFLHQEQGISGYVWTDYASGANSVQPHLAGVPLTSARFVSAGGDFLAYENGTTLTVGNPVTGTWIDYSLPQDGTVDTNVAGVGVDGTRAVVREGHELHLLQLNADATVADVAVTGLPTDPGYTTNVAGYQGPGDVVVLRSSGPAGSTLPVQLSLLRLDTGVASPLPATVPPGASVRISGGYLLWSQDGFHALKLDDAIGGTAATPVTVPYPAGTAVLDFAAVGQQIIVLTSSTATTARALYSVPLDGGPAVQLDSLVSQSVYPAPRPPYMLAQGAGGVLTVGGTATSQAVQLLNAAADGSVNVTAVRQLPPPAASTATLSMVHGQVRQVLTVPQLNAATRFAMATTPLAGAGSGVGRTTTGYLSNGLQQLQAGPCAVDASCVRERDGNGYGPVYTTTTATSAQVFVSGVSARENFASPDTRVVDADTQFVVIDSAGTQHLWEPGQGAMTTLGTADGAALWMGTLWRAVAPGRVQASTPHIGLGSAPTVQRTVSTGVSCTPSEVQVAQHWLYWSCGSSGPAGVLDLATNVGFGVDGGPALLGDGYLVRHDAASGELRLTDLHADSVGATSVLATFPQIAGASDDRGIDWTVDRTSGDVAYADADSSVHVLTTGVPPSAVTAEGGSWNNAITPGEAWNFSFEASRPLAGWEFVLRRATTGQVVYSYTGGPSAAWGSTVWNGFQAGKRAFDGDYRWQLLAVPADAPGAAPKQVATGTMAVFYGRMPFHSYGDDGQSTLLGVLKQSAFGYGYGYGMEYTGNGRGSYSRPAASSYWNLGTGSGQLNAVVPFGDLNGDGFNDIVVRTSGGKLEYYPNQAQGEVLNNTSPKVIGTGWNIYDRLVSVGDLNGDGRDDLMARDHSGALWLYAGNGHGGLASRVRIGIGWNTYSRLVGVGDLNGDGRGDLLAVDSHGYLWRYYGTSRGGLGGRVRLGTGYSGYTAITAVGDLNGDGHNDFVARDKYGVLWRCDGTGKGTFSARIRVGVGWNIYSGLY